jgi:NAD(P)-dependent dehydrogenase (short-subunit alcohol dehydrogenase family)
MRLEGRRILVVGAGTRPSPDDDPEPPPGNGRAISVRCAEEGATVACADRDADAAAETAALIEGAAVIVADAAEEHECRRMVEEAVAAMGGLDGVVLNVGVASGRDLAGTSAGDWDLTLGVNLRSHFLTAREALPVMDEGGALVFIGSIAGITPGSRIPAYDASKAAIPGLCRHVALEGARRGIRANSLMPGLIDTPLGRLASRGRPSRERTPVPLGRQGTPWEVAAAAVFLLSEDASYITGHTLVVDGGLSSLR